MDNYIWYVENDPSLNLTALLQFLLTPFIQIFGLNTMTSEKCIVYNDPSASCPKLIWGTVPIRIRLCAASSSHWAQIIFQLSHELTHYVYRQSRTDKDDYIPWFEEITCEAMSLYALDYAASNWSACQLSLKDPEYGSSISEYLKNELAEPYTNSFQLCNTPELLASYNAEGNRETHARERNLVYNEIQKKPSEMNTVTDYCSFRTGLNRMQIDTTHWYQKHPANLIKVIENLQPCKPFAQEE